MHASAVGAFVPCCWGRKSIGEGRVLLFSSVAWGGAHLLVAVVLSVAVFTAVPPPASLLAFSSSAGVLQQLSPKLQFRF